MTAVSSFVRDSAWRKSLRTLMARKSVLLGAIVLTIVVLLAIFAPIVAQYPPNKLSIINRMKPPSSTWWFGTDEFGRDVFSRVLYAGRTSLFVGAMVLLLSSMLGATLGLIAGFFRRADAVISRILDAMMAFPEILLAISLVAAFGPSVATVIVVLGIVAAPRFARIVRASTLVIRELSYVEAARALGISTPRIVVRHVVPNLLSPVFVQGSFIFAHAMLAEASLSFLGLGVSPDVPTWGSMIAAGRQHVGTADWLTFFPGVAIVLSVLSLQLIGDGLRDFLDPRLKRDV
jgi:peptide/nickel transport system permease protein